MKHIYWDNFINYPLTKIFAPDYGYIRNVFACFTPVQNHRPNMTESLAFFKFSEMPLLLLYFYKNFKLFSLWIRALKSGRSINM